MTDASIIAIVTVIGTLLTTIATGVIAILTARQKNQADIVARKLEASDVKTTVALSQIKDDTGKTLTHVNDQFLIQLRLYSESTQTIATLTNRIADQEKADAAQKLYLEHKIKQEEAAASIVAVQKEHTGIAREQLEVQKKIEANTSSEKVTPN